MEKYIDYLMEIIVNYLMNELSCIVLQILMILITYQKTFNFTHNDLHTNNIMFIETRIEIYLYK